MFFRLDSSKTALILIDLQNGIVGLPIQPLSADKVIAASRNMVEACRRQGAGVIFVRVDLADMMPLKVDVSHAGPGDAPVPSSASDLVATSGFIEGDPIVTKRHWGAFDATSGLEGALRMRGIETIILAGIATNLGVESTARQATSLGFHVVIAADACSALDASAHAFAMDYIFPLITRVRSVQEIIDALS